MTDADLRALERRSEAAHDPRDEQAVLVARLRAGTTTPARLALAAWLGDPLARATLGPDAPPPRADAADDAVPASALPLDEDGRRLLARAMAADLRLSPSWPDDPLGLQALDATERWAAGEAAPPPGIGADLSRLMDALVAAQEYDQAAWIRDVRCILELTGAAVPGLLAPPHARALDLVCGAGIDRPPPAMFRRVDATSLYRRARAALLAWALGSDPPPHARGARA